MAYETWTYPMSTELYTKYYQWTNPDSIVYSNTTVRNYSYSSVYSFRGKKVYYWFDFIRFRPEHAFERTKWISSLKHSVYIDMWYGTRRYIHWGNVLIGMFSSPTLSIVPQDEAIGHRLEAQLRAWADLNGPDAPIMTTLVESADLIRDLRKVSLGVLKTMAHFKKKGKTISSSGGVPGSGGGSPPSAIGDIAEMGSNAWLSYSLGLRPTLGEVDTYCEALSKPDNSRASGRGTSKTCEVLMTYHRSVAFHYTVLHWLETVREHKKCSQVIQATTKRNRTDWGMRNWDVQIAFYNAIPFSFVLDYFLDVATFLDAWRPSDAIVRGGCLTTKTRQSMSYTRFYGEHDSRVPSTAAPLVCNGTIEGCETSRESVWRELTVHRPTLPAFTQKRLSVIRQANLASLAIASAVRKLR